MTAPLDVFTAFVDAHNDWASTGDVAALLAMLAPEALVEFEGTHSLPTIRGSDAIAAYLAENRPDDSLTITFAEALPRGVSSTFRWTQQDDEYDAGNLTVECWQNLITKVVFEFFHWQDQPVPWIITAKETAEFRLY